jgi:hypothetical protein
MISRLFKPFLLLALLVTSCAEMEEKPAKDNMLVSSDVFTSTIGHSKAYGVQLRLTADEKSLAGYIIQLKVGSKVWLDTLKLEVPAGDTLETEVVFSESEVNESDVVELTVKHHSLGQ